MLNEHLHAAVRKNAAVFELGRAFDDIIISADISNSSCRQTHPQTDITENDDEHDEVRSSPMIVNWGSLGVKVSPGASGTET